jgi:hypothetical protein
MKPPMTRVFPLVRIYRAPYGARVQSRLSRGVSWRECNDAVNWITKHPWKRNQEFRKGKFTRQKLDYIHNNPVAEEIVGEPGHYLYSSARDYEGGKGYLEIEFIEWGFFLRLHEKRWWYWRLWLEIGYTRVRRRRAIVPVELARHIVHLISLA